MSSGNELTFMNQAVVRVSGYPSVDLYVKKVQVVILDFCKAHKMYDLFVTFHFPTSSPLGSYRMKSRVPFQGREYESVIKARKFTARE